MNLYEQMRLSLDEHGWKSDGPFGIWYHKKYKDWQILNVEPGYAVMWDNIQQGSDYDSLEEAVEAANKLIAEWDN
jgi:hypothetical protein